MQILRIEHAITNAGMWYNEKGIFCPVILSIPNAKAGGLPMNIDLDRYYQNNKTWLCGCYNIEMLEQWFSTNDRKELYARGYALFGIETNDFILEENQVLYNQNNITKKWVIEKQH